MNAAGKATWFNWAQDVRSITPADNVLDLGCGKGDLVHVATLGARLVGAWENTPRWLLVRPGSGADACR
ncbi:class I SAM-dependent methyltransferase [Streptomyces anulatus]|uniref:hypothetical protein n=1 Tax=Streptomyces anulatus TaxID=1892 RepID=UPI002E371FE7|nr:hypothetical protein [Streptomyces anulatus]